MIICHPLKIIFLKTKKVGGTSFEIALSKFCDTDCIITPVGSEAEATRKGLGFRGAQNDLEEGRIGFLNPEHINSRIRGNFKNHDPANKVARQVDPDIFDGYLKISIHRDPLDFLISQYYWRMRDRDKSEMTSFKDWFDENWENAYMNERIAPASGKNACDVIIRYENLTEDIRRIAQIPAELLDLFQTLKLKGSRRDRNSLNARRFFLDNGIDEGRLEKLLGGTERSS